MGHAEHVRTVLAKLTTGLYERDETIRLAFLASAGGESLFLWGPPGTAKSLVARRIACAYRDARTFEYLMGRFSTPEEIFGPISIKRLRDSDKYERITEGYLPDAEIVFLDEIWRAGPPIQNSLLTALNERLYRNGSTVVHLPIRCIIAASNEIPDLDDEAAAFWDRFLVRVRVDPVRDESVFRKMISDTDDPFGDPVPSDEKIARSQYETWRADAPSIAIPDSVLSILSRIRARLGTGSTTVTVSDRRWKKIVGLLRTSAMLNDRDAVNPLDCFLVRHCVWNRPDEIGFVNSAVEAAIAEYLSEGRFDAAPLRERLLSLEAAYESETTTIRDTTAVVPVEYRGEYVRVLGFPGAESALIWKGDFEALDENGRSTEVFVYDDDAAFVSSSTHTVARTDVGEVAIDGTPYEIDARTETTTVAEKVPPDPDVIARTRAGAIDIITECDSVIGEAGEFMRHGRSDASDHLFVDHRYVDGAFARVERCAREFASLKIDVEDFLRTIENAETR